MTDKRLPKHAILGSILREDVAYNCECQVGGVDASSIDWDWLEHAITCAKEEAVGLVAELDDQAAAVERVRKLHRPFGVYSECDCEDTSSGHVEVEDVGTTCNLLYAVCSECCTDDGYQREDCANYHDHHLGERYHCPTIRALDGEVS